MTTTADPISDDFEEWAEDYMDPINEILFEMRDDGGSPEEIALFLLHRAVAELRIAGNTRGEAHSLLSEHLHYSIDCAYQADGLNVMGTA